MAFNAHINKRRVLKFAKSFDPSAWRLEGQLDSVLHNGIGRYVNQLTRVTLFFCKQQSDSSGVRMFVNDGLVDFARANPGTAVYIQPHRFKSPYMVAEYLNGREVQQNLKNMPADELKKWLNYARTRSGLPIVSFEQNSRTKQPSVQGMWHSFCNEPTDMQVNSFPNEKYSAHMTTHQSATDIVRLLHERQLANVTVLDEEEHNTDTVNTERTAKA